MSFPLDVSPRRLLAPPTGSLPGLSRAGVTFQGIPLTHIDSSRSYTQRDKGKKRENIVQIKQLWKVQ